MKSFKKFSRSRSYHMWNLRNKTENHRVSEEKINQDEIREGDIP